MIEHPYSNGELKDLFRKNMFRYTARAEVAKPFLPNHMGIQVQIRYRRLLDQIQIGILRQRRLADDISGHLRSYASCQSLQSFNGYHRRI